MGENFARWLQRQIDRRDDLNVSGLAAKLHLNHTSVLAWLSGETEPSTANIRKLAREFHVDVADVYRALGRLPQSGEELPADFKRLLKKAQSLAPEDQLMLEAIVDQLLQHRPGAPEPTNTPDRCA